MGDVDGVCAYFSRVFFVPDQSTLLVDARRGTLASSRAELSFEVVSSESSSNDGDGDGDKGGGDNGRGHGGGGGNENR